MQQGDLQVTGRHAIGRWIRASSVRLVLTAAAVVVTTSLVATAASINVSAQRLTTHVHGVAATPTPTAPPVIMTCDVLPTDDTHVDQNVPTTAHGSLPGLNVRNRHNSNFTRFKRVFVRFSFQNLSSPACQSLSASSTIQSAILAFNVSSAPGDARTYSVQRVAAGAWTEANLTWNHTVNADTDAQPVTSSATVGPGNTNQYIVWNVKADIEAFLATPGLNNGWRMRDANEDALPTYETVFRSKEAGSLPPAVRIVYTP